MSRRRVRREAIGVLTRRRSKPSSPSPSPTSQTGRVKAEQRRADARGVSPTIRARRREVGVGVKIKW